jgi:hypothetical protein
MAGYPIHIFVNTNGVETLAFVNMGRDRMLEQDAMYSGITVETLNMG